MNISFFVDSMLPANLRNIESRVADIPVESAAEWSTSFHKLDVHSSSSTSGSDDEELPFFKKNHSSNVISTTNNSDFVSWRQKYVFCF